MTVALRFDMPESALAAVKKSPVEFADELRLAAAVKWYEMGIVSQEKAAEIAGVTRAEFIFSLTRFRVTPFQYSVEDIENELRHAD
jgi:predicted HTH domain antitoxin